MKFQDVKDTFLILSHRPRLLILHSDGTIQGDLTTFIGTYTSVLITEN